MLILVDIFHAFLDHEASDLWLWMSFLRTGRSDIFRMAYAMTRHLSEVDFHHIVIVYSLSRLCYILTLVLRALTLVGLVVLKSCQCVNLL